MTNESKDSEVQADAGAVDLSWEESVRLDAIVQGSSCTAAALHNLRLELAAKIAKATRPFLAAESDKRDAARYRWLRHADLDALADANWGKGAEVYTGEAFDDAIDAAMSREQSGGEA